MISRVLVLAAVFVCLAVQSRADPGLPTSFPDASALIPVQAGSEEIVIPVDYSGSKTPRLSIKDCAAYGSEYGYPECIGIPSTKPKRKFRPRAKKPDFPLAPYFQQYRPRKRVTPAPKQKAPPRSAEAKPNPYSDNAPRPEQRKPPRLSLQQLTKIAGELLIVTFDGQFTPEAGLKSIRDVLRSGAAGGVLIRNSNITSPFQLQALTSLLRDASKTPLLIAIERPGAGIEYPSKPGFKMFPTPREMARKKDPHAAFNAYGDMAKELLSVGVNMNIGPNANVCPENASRRLIAVSVPIRAMPQHLQMRLILLIQTGKFSQECGSRRPPLSKPVSK